MGVEVESRTPEGSGVGLRGSGWGFEAAELEHGGEAPNIGAGCGAEIIGQAGLPGAWGQQRAVLHVAQAVP